MCENPHDPSIVAIKRHLTPSSSLAPDPNEKTRTSVSIKQTMKEQQEKWKTVEEKIFLGRQNNSATTWYYAWIDIEMHWVFSCCFQKKTQSRCQWNEKYSLGEKVARSAIPTVMKVARSDIFHFIFNVHSSGSDRKINIKVILHPSWGEPIVHVDCDDNECFLGGKMFVVVVVDVEITQRDWKWMHVEFSCAKACGVCDFFVWTWRKLHLVERNCQPAESWFYHLFFSLGGKKDRLAAHAHAETQRLYSSLLASRRKVQADTRMTPNECAPPGRYEVEWRT